MAGGHAPPTDAPLLAALARAQEAGFLGAVPLEDHLDQARRMAVAAEGPRPRCLDLGSGGGVPALPLAWWWPDTSWILVEAQQRRADLLGLLVASLALSDRVTVDARRAEDVARDPAVRGAIDLVTARSFGPPAVVAECAAPVLRAGGWLVVSEPPDTTDRWPRDGLELLGLADRGDTAGCRRLEQLDACPERYPRRRGRPERAPLF